METPFKYYVPEHNESEDAYFFTGHGEKEARYFAEKAAHDYFHHHDGWEDTWPITFVVLDPTGVEVGRYSVWMEAVPEFTAFPVEAVKA